MAENEIAVRGQSKVDVFMGQVLPEQDRQAIRSALPGHVPFERFERNLANALMNEPKLLTCNPREVFREVAKIAALGLYIDPQLGEAYLIVGFNGREGRNVPQIRIGYRGLIRLVRQSGEITGIYAREVCAGDEFDCIEGTDRFLKHKPAYLNPDRGDPIGYYAVITMKDGSSDFEVMGIRDIHKIRDRSDGWKAFTAGRVKSTPWSTDEPEMARKTVIRRLVKRHHQSPDLASATRIEDEAENGDFVPAPSTRLQPGKADIIGKLAARTAEPAWDPETGEIDPDGQGEDQDQSLVDGDTRTEEQVVADEAKTPASDAPRDEPEARNKKWPTVYAEQMAAAKTLDEAKTIRKGVKDKLDSSSPRTKARVAEIYDETTARVSHGQENAGEEQKAGAADRVRSDHGSAGVQDKSETQVNDATVQHREGQSEDSGGSHENASSPSRTATEAPAPASNSAPVLHPDIPRGDWTEDEAKLLNTIARNYGNQPDQTELQFMIDSYRDKMRNKRPELVAAWESLGEINKDRIRRS